MKQRWLALALALVMTLSPALAAQGDGDAAARFPAVRSYEGFSDVAEDAWYTPYVKLCYEAGLMSGTGDGRFSPDQTLSYAETAVLAARLHQILSGGDGTLPAAPEDWGKIVMTCPDGTVIEGYREDFQWFATSRVDPGKPGVVLEGEEQVAWGRSQAGQAGTLRMNGTEFRGTLHTSTWSETKIALYVEPEWNEDTYSAYGSAIYWAQERPGPDKWYRDTAYYLETAGLEIRPGEARASRQSFVEDLSQVAGDLLTPINQIDTFPDIYEYTRDTVLPFYNAGILTGTDSYGTFGADLSLTRAETAAMAARLIRPELRIAFTPDQSSYRDYTLTEMDLQGYEVTSTITGGYIQLSLQDGEGCELGQGTLRPDGAILCPPSGWISYTADDGLQVLGRSDPTLVTGYAYAVLDLETGELVLPFGRYDEIQLLGDGRFLTRVNERDPLEPLTLRDRSGKKTGVVYSNEGVPCEGLTARLDSASGLWGYVDAGGAWIIQPRWQEAGLFRDGQALVRRDWLWGVIDRSGTEVIPCVHEDLVRCGSGLYRTNSSHLGDRERQWFRADGTSFINGYVYRDIQLSNGFFACGSCYLDDGFRPVTPPVFQWTGPVSAEGSAFVGMDGKVFRLTFQDGAGT